MKKPLFFILALISIASSFSLLQTQQSCESSGFNWMFNSHYEATYSFTNYTIGSDLGGVDSWILDANTPAGKVTIISSFLDHKDVVQVNDDSATYPYGVYRTFTARNNGAIEFWIAGNKVDSTVAPAFILKNGATIAADAYLYNNTLTINDVQTGIAVNPNTFYHIKIEVISGTSINWYLNSVFVKNTGYMNSQTQFNTIDLTSGTSLGIVKAYFDGIGLSWDPNYHIGDNAAGGCCGDDVVDLRKGLIREFHLDENTGTSALENINNYNGTLYNSPLWVSGKYGSALSFDGTAYVSASNAGMPTGTQPKTVTAWAYPTAVDSAYHQVFAYGLYGAVGRIFSLGIDGPSNKWVTSQYGAGVMGSVAVINQWIFLSATYDGNYYKLYENGVLTAMGQMTTNVVLGTLYIGDDGYQGATGKFKGKIDELRFYNRALSNREIEYLYEMNPYAYINYTDTFYNGTKKIDSNYCQNNNFYTSLEEASSACNSLGFNYLKKDWLDEGFRYRKNITIANSGSALIDYQVAVNPSTYSTAGLIASYHFSEGGSSVKDYSGINNYGTVYSGNELINGTYQIKNFTTAGSTTWYAPLGVNQIEVLVVAGGGGGGKAEANPCGDGAGGGGAGGLIYNPSYSVVGNITVIVGDGGAGTTSGTYPAILRGANGLNSVFGGLIAIGGGGGGSDNDNTNNLNKGADGGSGGGAANSYNVDVAASSGVLGQGNAGGHATGSSTSWRGGSGGGGAGTIGLARTSGVGAAGGSGLNYSISGSNIYYAGGAGGGGCCTTGGSGGSGGGGAGGNSGGTGTAGTANTGGGGGGGGSNGGSGGNGGSGVVVLKYNMYVKGYEEKGTGLSFDGADDYVNLSASALEGLTAAGTISAWIKLGTNNEETIIAKQLDGTGTYGAFTVGFYSNSAGTPTSGTAGKLYFHGHNGVDAAASTSALNIGQWYHVAAVFTTSNVKFYINGVLDNTINGDYSVSSQTSPTATAIGAWLGGGGGRYFNGIIDELQVYSSALDAAEISNLYNERYGRLDYADLRFYNSTGSELNYWTEYDNTTWVKVPSIPAGSSNITMYYGSPGATSRSNGELTFEFFDDFNDDVVDTGKWQDWTTASNAVESRGILSLVGQTDNDIHFYTTKKFINPYVFHARYLRGVDGGLFYEVQDASNGYLIALRDSTQVAANKYEFHKRVSSSWYGLGALAAAVDTNWHIFDVFRSSSSMSINEDGVFKLTGTADSTFTNGYVGFRCWQAAAPVYADYAFVRKYSSAEPAITVQFEESIYGNATGLVAYYSFDNDINNKTIDSTGKNIGSLYGSTVGLWHFDESGGSIIYDSTSYKNNGVNYGSTVETFTTAGSTTWAAPLGVAKVEVLVVAGGGSGGGSAGTSIGGGGGGAGGLIYNPSYPVAGIINVTVGAGGVGVSGFVAGNKGGNSVFGILTAVGGGYGGTWDVVPTAGGSGGGAGENGQSLDGAAGIILQGNAGGNDLGYDSGAPSAGGGGGGAGAIGANVGSTAIGGAGGAGLPYSISGSSVYYAGGGGGAGSTTLGAGGNGGGGAGKGGTTGTGTAGTANTGGGGGGSLTNANEASQPGGNGGSGVVIIKYYNYTNDAKSGTALSFDGVNDYINLGSGPSNIAGNNFALCVWFKTTGTEEDIISNGVSSNGNFLLMSYLTKLRGHVWYSDYSNAIDSNAVVNNGAWQFGCQVVNSTHISLFINGVLDKTQALSGTKTGVSSTVFIGSRSATAGTYNFVGTIDEVAIYNKSLTSDEVTFLYNSTRAQFMEHVSGYQNKSKGVEFDGVNDYINLSSAQISGSGNVARSIFAWIKTSSARQTIIATGTAAGSAAFNLVIGYYNSNAVLGLMGYGYDYYPTSGRALNDNLWHFVGVTFDGSTVRLYVDGVLDNSIGSRTYATTGQNNYIGSNNHAGNEAWFSGSIDDVRVYNRALGVTEISELYNSAVLNYGCCGNDYGYDNFYNNSMACVSGLATSNADLWNDFCAYSGRTAFYGSVTGSNGPCCGDDGLSDIFYNSSIGATNYFCQQGAVINQEIDANQTICNYYSYNWLTQSTTADNYPRCCNDDLTSDLFSAFNADLLTAQSATCERCNAGSYLTPITYYGNGYSFGLSTVRTCHYGNIICSGASGTNGTSAAIYGWGYYTGNLASDTTIDCRSEAAACSDGGYGDDSITTLYGNGYLSGSGTSRTCYYGDISCSSGVETNGDYSTVYGWGHYYGNLASDTTIDCMSGAATCTNGGAGNDSQTTLYGNGIKVGSTCHYGTITCSSGSEANGTSCALSSASDACIAGQGCLNYPALAGAASINSTNNSGLNNYINLTWASTGVTPTGYYLENSTDGITYTQLIQTSSANYIDYSATIDNTMYYYRIKAYYSAYNSSYAFLTISTSDRTGYEPSLLSVNNNTNSAAITNLMNDSGLVLYMPFEENTGVTTQDWTSSNNDGTLSSASWTAGKYGNAINTGTYVVHSTAGLSSTSGTVEAWVKPVTGTDNFWGIWQTHDSASVNFLDWIWLGVYSDTLFFRIGDGSSCCANDLGLPSMISYTPVDTWSHVAATWNGDADSAADDTMNVYINGILVVTRINANLQGIMDPYARIGFGHTYAADGPYDEVRIYNRSLSQREIINDMQSGKPYFELFISNTSAGTYSSVISQNNIYEDTRANDTSLPDVPISPAVTPLSTTSLQISWSSVGDNGNNYYFYSKNYDYSGNSKNILDNSGFEKDAAGTATPTGVIGIYDWTGHGNTPQGTGSQVINTQNYTGINSYKLSNDDDSMMAIYYPFNPELGKDYMACFWAKKDSGTITVRMQANQSYYDFSITNDWQRYCYTFIQSSGAGNIQFANLNYNNYVYLDDVEIFKIESKAIVSGVNSYQANGSDATTSGWTNSAITVSSLGCFTNYSYSVKAKDNANNVGFTSQASEFIYPISFVSGCSGAAGFCINSAKCYVSFNCTGFNCQQTGCNGANVSSNTCVTELCDINGYSLVNHEIINGCNCSLNGTCGQGYCQKDTTCNYGLNCTQSGWSGQQCEAINECVGDCALGTCNYSMGGGCSITGCGDGANHNPDEASIYCTGCGEEWAGSACCGDDADESFSNEGVNNPCCYNGVILSNYERQNNSLLCYNGLMYDCNNQVSDPFPVNSNTGDSKGELTCSQNNTWTGLSESYAISYIETQSQVMYFESGSSALSGLSFNITNPSLDYQSYELELYYTQGYSHFSETKANTQTITIPPKSTKTVYINVYPTIVGEIIYTLSASNINNPEEYLVRQFSVYVVMPIREETGEIIYSADELTIFDLIVSFLNKIFFR